MQRPLAWGIDQILGGLAAGTAGAINAEEELAVKARRRYYQGRLNPPPAAGSKNVPLAAAAAVGEVAAVAPPPPHHQPAWIERSHATALASGAVSARPPSRSVCWLRWRGATCSFNSTISPRFPAADSFGSFLTTFLNTPDARNQPPAGAGVVERPKIGLLRGDLPFRREDGEAAALRHVRHHSKYLVTGRLWERLQMAFTQVYGMALNGLGFAYLAVVAALIEYVLRQVLVSDSLRVTELSAFAAIAGTSFLISMAAHRRPNVQKAADTVMTLASLALIASLLWRALDELHVLGGANSLEIAGAAALPLLASALLALRSKLPFPIRIALIVLSILAAPVVLVGIEVKAYAYLKSNHDVPLLGMISGLEIATVLAIIGLIWFWFFFDINFTAPYRYYRRKLGEAYLVQPDPASIYTPLRGGVSLRLSKCTEAARAPYHLVNCALNVPASEDPAMQGRLTDFFLFSPRNSAAVRWSSTSRPAIGSAWIQISILAPRWRSPAPPPPRRWGPRPSRISASGLRCSTSVSATRFETPGSGAAFR